MHLEVKPGDRIYHVVSGSGGHGDPFEREPEKVLADVRDEKLSVPRAREQYGGVIDVETAEINIGETEALRAQRLESAAAAD